MRTLYATRVRKPINLDLRIEHHKQRIALCKCAGSTVVEVAGSHAIYVSQPKAVAKLISAVAQSAGN